MPRTLKQADTSEKHEKMGQMDARQLLIGSRLTFDEPGYVNITTTQASANMVLQDFYDLLYRIIDAAYRHMEQSIKHNTRAMKEQANYATCTGLLYFCALYSAVALPLLPTTLALVLTGIIVLLAMLLIVFFHQCFRKILSKISVQHERLVMFNDIYQTLELIHSANLNDDALKQFNEVLARKIPALVASEVDANTQQSYENKDIELDIRTGNLCLQENRTGFTLIYRGISLLILSCISVAGNIFIVTANNSVNAIAAIIVGIILWIMGVLIIQHHKAFNTITNDLFVKIGYGSRIYRSLQLHLYAGVNENQRKKAIELLSSPDAIWINTVSITGQ